MLGMPFIAPFKNYDAPGAVRFTSGSTTFVIPKYQTSLQFVVWGGGAGGRATGNFGAGNAYGSNGGNSNVSTLGLYANGSGWSGGSYFLGSYSGGTGGASGNAPGTAPAGGTAWYSGSSANPGNPAACPSTGGNGNLFSYTYNTGGGEGGGTATATAYSSGGPSGAACYGTYAVGALTPGTVVSLTVGAAGSGATIGGNSSSPGIRGEVYVHWS